MSFAVVARALVARQADAGVGGESSFSTLAISGISLSGAAFFVLIGVGMIHFGYIRHKRRREMEQITIANSLSNPHSNQQPGVVGPQASLTNSLRMRNGAGGSWGVLASQEDLQVEVPFTRRRTEKRKSELLSWPLPRRISTRRANLPKQVRDSQLSAILESPNSHGRSPQSAKQLSVNVKTEAPLPAELEAIPLADDPDAKGRSNSNAQAESSFSQSSPSGIIRPTPLFDNIQSGGLNHENSRPKRIRSISGPSVLTNVPGVLVLGTSSRNLSNETNSRSLSLGTNIAAPPTGPLPPLPKLSDSQRSLEQITQERPHSAVSASSIDSFGTSILNSPNTSESIDFSQRHPEMSLGAQIRRNDSDVKRTLMAGPRQGRIRSKISKSPRLMSSVASLRITSARNSIELKRLSISDANNAAKRNSRLSLGSLQTAQTIVLSRPSSRSSQNEKTLPIVTTPRRNSQTKRLSDAFGSPIERRRSSFLKSALENSSMPLREISQTSMQTSSSASPANPFQWDTPHPSTKPSSLKASPTSKRTHKRQSSIRNSVGAAYQHPPSRSNSSSKMGLIAEEPRSSKSFDGSLEFVQRPPTSSTFAPHLSNPTLYRASLTSRSPRLSLVQYDQDSENGDGLSKHGFHARDLSPKKAGSRPDSKTSSIFIPTFPVSGSGGANNDSVSEHLERENNPVSAEHASSSPFSSSPRQHIPGLSLLEENNVPMQELQFPTIQVFSNPEAECQDYEPDSPVIPCPSSPRPAQAQLPSSPPIPRSLSPTLKSSPTTHVSQPPPPIPSQRITPLSSIIHPMNTKPNFLPPIELPPHPNGLRVVTAPDVLKTAKTLRRMNPESEMGDGQEALRYFHIRRESSPNASRADIQFAISPLEKDPEWDEEKENDGYRRGGVVWDDGDDFWNTNNANDKMSQILLETPITRPLMTKRVAWGGVDVKEKTPSAASDGRASFGEEDFF